MQPWYAPAQVTWRVTPVKKLGWLLPLLVVPGLAGLTDLEQDRAEGGVELEQAVVVALAHPDVPLPVHLTRVQPSARERRAFVTLEGTGGVRLDARPLRGRLGHGRGGWPSARA